VGVNWKPKPESRRKQTIRARELNGKGKSLSPAGASGIEQAAAIDDAREGAQMLP